MAERLSRNHRRDRYDQYPPRKGSPMHHHNRLRSTSPQKYGQTFVESHHHSMPRTSAGYSRKENYSPDRIVKVTRHTPTGRTQKTKDIIREKSPQPVRTRTVQREKSPGRYDANKTNLHVWGQWRTEVNENLITDFFETTDRRNKKRVKPLETKIKHDGVFDYSSKHDQTRALMNYSLSTNRVTDLEPNDFLRYGIPRAKINSSNKGYRQLFPAEERNGKDEIDAKPYSNGDIPNGNHTMNSTERSTLDHGKHNGYRETNGHANYAPEQTRSQDTMMSNGYGDRSYDSRQSHPQYQAQSHQSNGVNKRHQQNGGKIPRGGVNPYTPRTDYSNGGDTYRDEPSNSHGVYASVRDSYTKPFVPPAPPPPPIPASAQPGTGPIALPPPPSEPIPKPPSSSQPSTT